jgi:acyl dehydratase
VDLDRHLLRGGGVKRTLTLTPELLQAYSRRGNFHSDPDAARALGYDRLVAQGMQVAGPAYGLLLDEWGDEFLAHGELELKFVGMTTDGESVAASVEVADDGTASLEVVNTSRGAVAVVGRARRSCGEAS